MECACVDAAGFANSPAIGRALLVSSSSSIPYVAGKPAYACMTQLSSPCNTPPLSALAPLLAQANFMPVKQMHRPKTEHAADVADKIIQAANPEQGDLFTPCPCKCEFLGTWLNVTQAGRHVRSCKTERAKWETPLNAHEGSATSQPVRPSHMHFWPSGWRTRKKLTLHVKVSRDPLGFEHNWT